MLLLVSLLLAHAIFTITKILLFFQLYDFSIYYQSIQLLLSNQSPYHNQGFVINYPPTALLFFFPFGIIPYGLSEKIWTFLSVSALITSIFFILKLVNKKLDILIFLLVFGLAMLSFPVKYNLGMGQVNLFILLLVSLCFYGYRNNNKNFAGVALGVASAIKLAPVLLLFFFIRKKEFKLVTMAVLTVFSTTFLTIFLFGKELWQEYVFKVFPNLPTIGNNIYYNQALTGFLARIDLSGDAARILNYTILLLLLLISILITKTKRQSLLMEMNEYSLFIVLSLIGVGLSWQHHFVLLVIPFLAIFYSFQYISKRYLKIFLLLMFLGYILISVNIKNPQIFNGVFILLLSHVLYGTILLYVLLTRIISLLSREKNILTYPKPAHEQHGIGR